MHKVKSLVDNNLAEIKTIADLASIVDVPPATLGKVFLRKEKIHLGDYIMKRKVDAMKELLLISDDPCYNVCYSVGLREDVGEKVFKKFSGLSTQEFKEKYKKEFEQLKNHPNQQLQLRLLAEVFPDK